MSRRESLHKIRDLLIQAGYDVKLSPDGQSILVDYGEGYEVVDVSKVLKSFGWDDK
jgi:hypothetical protein